jgi:hydrogenase/urease accessory protein HupE
LSRGTYHSTPDGIRAELLFAQGELIGLSPELDRDVDGRLSQPEIDGARALLARTVLDGMDVQANGKPCRGALDSVRLVEADGVRLEMHFTCASSGGARVDLGFLRELPFGHRHLATLVDGAQSRDAVLFRDQPDFELRMLPTQVEAGRNGWFIEFVRLGIEHILTGFDHLVFLLGLLLVGGKLRELLRVVTAFTLAHSVTLALAALGVVQPSPRLVEPMIALSIAYVGLENFWVKNLALRWRITLMFGLIHGFGFAGALQERGLPAGNVPGALLAFNLGVELGQIAVLAATLPLLRAAARAASFQRVYVRVLNVAVIGAGLVWFVQRL